MMRHQQWNEIKFHDIEEENKSIRNFWIYNIVLVDSWRIRTLCMHTQYYLFIINRLVFFEIKQLQLCAIISICIFNFRWFSHILSIQAINLLPNHRYKRNNQVEKTNKIGRCTTDNSKQNQKKHTHTFTILSTIFINKMKIPLFRINQTKFPIFGHISR